MLGPLACILVSDIHNDLTVSCGLWCAGIDDAASECDLDTEVKFDVIIDNNGDDQTLRTLLTDFVDSVNSRLND